MITISYIKSRFPEYNIFGNQECSINNVSTYNKANSFSLIWLGSKIVNQEEVINNTNASLIICLNTIKLDEVDLLNKSIIISENPRMDFIKIASLLSEECPFSKVDSSVKFIGTNTISNSANIAPGCVIINSVIGDNVYIYPNCTISNAIINENVKIASGTQIGSDGFGYEKDSVTGELIKFPHFGKVIIHRNVDIGANTCIDRGTINDTIIEENTKIDNLVHIAHNVHIGKNCAVIAHAMIGGSTIIKDNVWISPSSVIRDGIVIGENTLIGMGSVVTKNIPPNEIWVGNPAKFLKTKSD